MLDRCDFLRASADALTGLDTAAVDVVTARSVLGYVTDKAEALREFHRVLRAGGRMGRSPAVLLGTVPAQLTEPYAAVVR